MNYQEIDDFGDGQKFIPGENVKKIAHIPGPDAIRLADLMLHDMDMVRCLSYLNELDRSDEHNKVVCDSLWESAVATFYKCFQESKGRFTLRREDIFGDDSAAVAAFKFFKNLRNKHILHDENSYLQCWAYVVLRPEDQTPPAAAIMCKYARCPSGDAVSRKTMGSMANAVRHWCGSEYAAVEAKLLAHLNTLPYPTLHALPEEEPFKAAQPEDIGKTRKRL